MPSFKDNTGREWLVNIEPKVIHEVRKVLDFNLVAIDGSAFEQIDNDPVLTVDTLWILCRSQANGMTDEQFGRALVGDPIDSASEALKAAIADFFPAGKRSLLRSLAEKSAAVQKSSMELTLANINDPALLEKIEQATQRRMEEALTRLTSATNSPESAESTPRD